MTADPTITEAIKVPFALLLSVSTTALSAIFSMPPEAASRNPLWASPYQTFAGACAPDTIPMSTGRAAIARNKGWSTPF
jgi:hypothetical protein